MADDPQREAEQLENVPLPEAQATLFGHQQVWDTLNERGRAGRIPGGILLHGPRGIGKATLAFALAREIIAGSGEDDIARVTTQIALGSHPNLFVLRRQPRDKTFYASIRVDDIRKVHEQMGMTRGTSGRRICLIDSIDDANRESANALLKLLEEPPVETHFILISHRPAGLLPTIRSRCQSFPMRPLDEDAMRELGANLFPDVPTNKLQSAVDEARGAPRQLAEIIGFGELAWLQALDAWLSAPERAAPGSTLTLADQIVALSDPEKRLARQRALEFFSNEARSAAHAPDGQHQATRFRLASATQLWDKATAMLTEADIYNLDARQTFAAIFDSIREHAIKTRAGA